MTDGLDSLRPSELFPYRILAAFKRTSIAQGNSHREIVECSALTIDNGVLEANKVLTKRSKPKPRLLNSFESHETT